MAHRRHKRDYDCKIAGLYDLEETIGEGHFAVVKLARHVFTGEKVAVKVIDKNKLDEVSRSHLFQEVRCMKLVQHPNVVRLYEVIDTQTKLYLILELGDGGDMYDHIMKHENGLDESKARAYFRQIVEAISYCHRLHVVHRDLKPENVVFFKKLGIVKLTDFGFSNMFNPGKKLETSCGSLAYSAPEILLGDSYDAQAVDIWSLGVILFMLVCGKPPFQEANDSETLTMIMDCIYKFPRHVSEECKELISSMLKREPGHRAHLVEIEEHQWLKVGARDVVHHHMPLISREHISDDDHNNVIEKMVDGNIATKEDILESLEKDSYDHITATYYLLAERRLRRQRQELLNAAAMSHLRKHSAPLGGKPHLEPLALSPRKQHEIKKTKTAPVPQKFSQMLLPESPSSEGPTTDYFTSLTTSMTLDRRAKLRTPVGREGRGVVKPSTSPQPPLIPRIVEPVKPVKKKTKQFSKIAILSSFFERKAADAAWTGPPDKKPGGFWRLPGFVKKKSKVKPRGFPDLAALDTPALECPEECECDEEFPCVHFKKEAESRDDAKLSKPKSLVHSLLSPPGVHPSPSTSLGSSPAGSPVGVNRKYSLIKEESLDDDGDGEDDEDEDMDIDAGIESVRICKSADNLDDIVSHTSLDSPVKELDTLMLKRPLLSVASSPQLLNQICEENESEEEDNFVTDRFNSPRMSSQRNSTASPEVIRKFEARKKRRGHGSRGTSCSSSDASDTDDTEGRSRKDKLKHKFAHRRDSSDHSSDTDGGPGGGGFGRGLGEGSGGGAGPSNDGNDGGGGGGKKGGKGGSPRNSRKGSHKGKQNNLNFTLGGDVIPLSLIERTSDTNVCSGVSNMSLNSRTSKSSLKYVLERDEDIQESDVEDNDKENDDANHIEQLNKKNKNNNSSKDLHRCSNSWKDLHKGSNGLRDLHKNCNGIKELNMGSTDLSIVRDEEKAEVALPDVVISPCSPDCDLSGKRPCPNGKISLKMDINSNAFCKKNHSELTPIDLETKCCSLI